MLALCRMLLATYYAQNYAGIIGWSLAPAYYAQVFAHYAFEHCSYYAHVYIRIKYC